MSHSSLPGHSALVFNSWSIKSSMYFRRLSFKRQGRGQEVPSHRAEGEENECRCPISSQQKPLLTQPLLVHRHPGGHRQGSSGSGRSVHSPSVLLALGSIQSPGHCESAFTAVVIEEFHTCGFELFSPAANGASLAGKAG